MERDMELIRKILFDIEKQSNGTWIPGLKIDGYTSTQVAYHCNLLYEGGYVFDCKIQYAGDESVDFFGVGHLTWEGHELLDKIRSDTVWNRTKDTVLKNGLPMVLDVVKNIASTIISNMTEGAIKAMKQ